MRIEVSDEVAKELDRLSTIFNATKDDLLRRLLHLQDQTESKAGARPLRGNGGLQTSEGVSLPPGLQLRRTYKGREYRAAVEDGGIRVEGVDGFFPSPSRAGSAITRSQVNGWIWWEYLDGQKWRTLDHFRQRARAQGRR